MPLATGAVMLLALIQVFHTNGQHRRSRTRAVSNFGPGRRGADGNVQRWSRQLEALDDYLLRGAPLDQISVDRYF